MRGDNARCGGLEGDGFPFEVNAVQFGGTNTTG